MPLYQELKSLDGYFRTTSSRKVILNDINFYKEDEKNAILSNIMQVYEDNVITTVPQCDCGKLKGKYLLGKVCNICFTEVKDHFDKTDPYLWVRKLEPGLEFISPQFWLEFRNKLSKSIDILRWFSDPTYKPDKPLPVWIKPLIKSLPGFKRDYRYFVEHIEDIMIFLINNSTFKSGGKDVELKILLKLFRESKDKVFSDYIPILNKSLFVMEVTNNGKYTNLIVSDIYDSVIMIMKITSEMIDSSKASQVTSKFLSKMADVFESKYNDYFSKKPGLFRKHSYGARSHFTARCVIVSIPGPHSYNEVHLPWSVAVVVLRPHLLNKLKKRGYNYKQASNMLIGCVKRFDPLISELLDELIAEAPYKGIPLIIQRNPSLLQGSAINVYCTKIKKDPLDNTMAVSVLVVVLGNGDFDGDELNITFALDNFMAEKFKTLSPRYSIAGTATTYDISGLLGVPKPVTATLMNYLTHNEGTVNTEDPKLKEILKTVAE